MIDLPTALMGFERSFYVSEDIGFPASSEAENSVDGLWLDRGPTGDYYLTSVWEYRPQQPGQPTPDEDADAIREWTNYARQNARGSGSFLYWRQRPRFEWNSIDNPTARCLIGRYAIGRVGRLREARAFTATESGRLFLAPSPELRAMAPAVLWSVDGEKVASREFDSALEEAAWEANGNSATALAYRRTEEFCHFAIAGLRLFPPGYMLQVGGVGTFLNNSGTGAAIAWSDSGEFQWLGFRPEYQLHGAQMPGKEPTDADG